MINLILSITAALSIIWILSLFSWEDISQSLFGVIWLTGGWIFVAGFVIIVAYQMGWLL